MINKTIVITGASRGIGEATARHFADLGAHVVLAARSQPDIETIAQEINDMGGKAKAIVCDVADNHSVVSLFKATMAWTGRVDVLVNNAGLIDPIARIENSDPTAWSKVIDVNIKGVFYATHAAIPIMKASGGGTIINISSGAATSALEGWSHYCASKAAVLMLTRMVAKEEGANGIRCLGLSPGTVATDMQKKIKASGINPVSQLDPQSHISPLWVAKALAWLVKGSEQARAFDGGDFSLKNDEGRRLVGLPPVD